MTSELKDLFDRNRVWAADMVAARPGDAGVPLATLARLLRGRWRLLGITTSAERKAELRAAGIVPLVADLDAPVTLQRAAGLVEHKHTVHLFTALEGVVQRRVVKRAQVAAEPHQPFVHMGQMVGRFRRLARHVHPLKLQYDR